MAKIKKFFEDKLYIFLLVFSFALFISNAVANIAMGFVLGIFIIWSYKNKALFQDNLKQNYVFEGINYYFYGPCIFMLAVLVSVLCSDNVGHGLKIWLEKWPLRYIFFIIPILYFDNEKKVKRIFTTLLLGFFISCLYLIGNSLVLGRIHVNGFYGHIMMYAGFICLLFPVLLIMCFYNKMDVVPRKCFYGLLVVSIVALICTGIRGAWLACAISLIFIILVNLRKNLKLALLVLLCCSLAGFSLSFNKTLSVRFNSITNISTDYSNTSRLYMWRSAIAMYKDNPLVGVGEGQYRTNMENKYRTPELKHVFDHAHSIIFHVLCVDGIIGLISMLFMFGSIIIVSLKRYFLSDNPWCLAMSMSTLTLFLQGLTEYNIGQSSIMKAYWLLLGLMFILAHYYNCMQNRGTKDDE